MPHKGTTHHRWSVILAGGEGMRLRPITKLIVGDERPKQFCRLLGKHTLLTQTRERLQGIAPEHHMSFLLLKAHERYFCNDVADIDPSRLFIQPINKGTTAAVVFGLLRLIQLDEDAIVGFFPADHDFLDASRFALATKVAFEEVESKGDRIILIGAQPSGPEIDYGWIEPGASIGDPTWSLSNVTRFWEKPPLPVAEDLFQQGSLWNTFVMVGRIRVFLNALAVAAPHALETLCPVVSGAHRSGSWLHDLYQALYPGDFSQQVLRTSTHKLAVVRMSDAGWTDLGTQSRLLAAMKRHDRTIESSFAAEKSS